MKDSINYQKGSSIVSDLKSVSSVIITSRKAKVFLYAFVFSFVACTTYLAFFDPPVRTGFGTGVPRFNNLFSSAASSTAPYRSQVSNFFSHLLPNSSSLAQPEEAIKSWKGGAGGNEVTKEGTRFQTNGDTRNQSVEELGFSPTKDQGLDDKLKQSESRNLTSTSTPPVVTEIPAKKDSNIEKQSGNINHAARAPPATQEVKKKDGNLDERNQKSSKNQTSNGSQGNLHVPKTQASTVPAKSGESGNQIRTATSPPGNETTVTKSQGSKGSQSNNAPVPSGSKSASPGTAVNKSQGSKGSQSNNAPVPSGSKSASPGTAVNKSQGSKGSQSNNAPVPSGSKSASPGTKNEKTTSLKNIPASLAKGNESLKGPPKTAPNTESNKRDDLIKAMIGCDMFQGQWVKDDSYPLYPEGSCPHIDEPFDCYHNGRPDRSYQKLRWQPHGCKIPRFNAIDMLERLRGKRLVFVGDSLNRNMWESLVCALRHSVKDKLKVFEASGRHEFRTEGSYSFLFTDYNCSVEFFRSPFLVQEWEMPTGNSTTKETLRIDLIERSSPKYKDADVLVFNTGHWWTHEKTSQGKDYYQEGNHVYSELNVLDAFHKALSTWAKWIDAYVNSKKTIVLFRGYSASHFSGGQWNSGGACDKETEPIKDDKYLAMYPTIMNQLEDVINGMKTPVVYLNITKMSDYRKDAHPSIYRKQYSTEEERRSDVQYQDCSHWCLPGVPDSWNELLYAQILVKQTPNER